MKNLINTLLITTIILTLCRCSDDNMYMSNQHAVQIGFYSVYTNKDSTLKSFYSYGIGREDSLIYDSASVSQIFLPLKFDEETTQFVLKTTLAKTIRLDTLTLTATKTPTFVNGKDGFAFDFKLTSVKYTTLFIDTVIISNAAVNYNEISQNVKVYLY